MVNMTLALPEDIHSKMKHFSEIKWTEVARKAIENKLKDLEVLEKIASKSKLTQKDMEELGKKIKMAASKRFMEQ
ncbi:MAG TPA: hypothetical protein VJI68_01165 [Candidatus Nanoarchaeia archaeon]|nr:hypothetical protein [Candidatus Nanoarchaeia archaeon]